MLVHLFRRTRRLSLQATCSQKSVPFLYLRARLVSFIVDSLEASFISSRLLNRLA